MSNNQELRAGERSVTSGSGLPKAPFSWLGRVTTGHMDDFSAEATELVETYGWFLPIGSAFTQVRPFLDFLMKYIIIGSSRTTVYLLLYILKLPIGEAGSGKSCLLHHFTHNSCTRFISCAVNGLPSLCLVKAHSQHTIGVEFSSRTVKLGEKRIKLQVRQHPPLPR